MQWWLKSSRVVVVVVVLVSLCVPQGRAMYTYSCDGQFLTLQCPAGALHIRSAMFGKNANGQFRCGESSRIYRPCETDITEFMRYKCQGQTFCRVHVELATFNLETFCPEFIKYAEIHFDCLPRAALQRAHTCRANCMPAPSPSFGYNGMQAMGQAMGVHNAHMMGGGPGAYGASNAVLQGPQVTGPSSQPGVIYSHHGGMPVHVPSSGAMGAGQQNPKGFGSPPMEPLPGIPEPPGPQPSPPQGSNPQGASVLQGIRSHGTGATISGQGQSGNPSPSASHDALIAKIGQMIGAARRGHVG